jgi:hypothetical protein
MLGVLGPLFRTAGHTVRTQHGITASEGQRRGDVELRSYLQDAAGRRSLVFDLSMTHDRFGCSSHVQQNGLLSHPKDLDAPLRLTAQRKINGYRQQYADNQNISFLPAIMSTSTRMHGEFLRLPFLEAHRETEAHITAAGMSLQRNQSDSFRFKRAAFYQSLKSNVGLAAAKAAALRINLNVEGCGIVAAPVHAPSRAPLLPPLLLSHNLPAARILQTEGDNRRGKTCPFRTPSSCDSAQLTRLCVFISLSLSFSPSLSLSLSLSRARALCECVCE